MASNYYIGKPKLARYNPFTPQPYGPYPPQLESRSFQNGFSQKSPRTPTTPRRQNSLEPLVYNEEPSFNHDPMYGSPSALLSSFPIFLQNWWLCIVSLFTSVLSLAAIITLLRVVDNQVLPDLPLGIRVNTYVSFFSVISKASMLVAISESISQLKWLWFRQPRTLQDIQTFDDASRGPLGALRLAWTTKGANLVVLGCAVTVLCMVMDPFAQQIVSYPVRTVDAAIAIVGRAQAYDAGLSLDSLDSGLLTGPEFGMKAAVYDGLFKPGNVIDLTASCLTGNCTFPLFDSLAVCSKCLDVTKDVINNNPQPSKLDGVENISYTIPGGATVEFSVLYQDGNLAMGPSLISTTVLPDDLPKEVLGLQGPLLTLAVLQFPQVQMLAQEGNYYSASPVTTECALYFCVNTYNVTVINSVSNTTVLSSWTSDTGTPTVGGAAENGDNNMAGTVDAILERPDDKLEENNTYSIPAGSLANLKAWLNVTLQGSLNTTFSEVDGATWAVDEMVVLNATTNWPYLFDKLATAMTTYIQSSWLPGPTNNVEGIAHRLETYVHVQWAWIALPGVLVLLSIVFLGATMAQNESKRALAWKSSSLALLFHGLEGVRDGTGQGLGQIREVAKRTRVVLQRGDNWEWKLISTG